MLPPLVNGLLVCFLLCIAFGPLHAWVSLMAGFSLGFLCLLLMLVVVVGRLRLGTTLLDIEEVLSGATDSDVHIFVADVIKSFDTVDRFFFFWIGCCLVLGFLVAYVMPILSSCSCYVAV